jgi:DNA invertase Pin-like site-specific DNA recombinase
MCASLSRPKKAVGYIRVSTQRQADDGFGLEFQRDRILSYARERGFVVTMIYEDVFSGNDWRSNKDRPDLRVALDEAKRIRGVIIVARLDRVSRNHSKFLEFCRSATVRVVSTVPGETDKPTTARKAVLEAQSVRENIAAGTKRTRAGAKARGKSLGNPATLRAANRSSSKSRIGNAFEGACRRAGLTDVTPHTLKHTAITWAIQKGLSVEDAADYFDTSAETIRKVYCHHSPAYQDRAVAILERKL